MWSFDSIADAAADALRARDSALREEQAVYGLDAGAELDLHPIIAEGLKLSGHGVLREQPYPHEWFRKLRPPKDAREGDGLALPIPRDRMRCDLVLTPEPNQTLDDSLKNEKQRRADELELQGTLFEALSQSHLAPGSVDPPHLLTSTPAHLHTLSPESAFWLELKICGQYTNTTGLPGPNRSYTSELTRNPITDLKKLAEDHRIHHAGVLLIVFTESEAVAKHDLAILAHRCRATDLPIPLSGLDGITRAFPIPDRIGNTLCTLRLIPLRKD